MINEGAILFSEEEKNNIKTYLSKIEKYGKSILKREDGYSKSMNSGDFSKLLTIYSSKINPFNPNLHVNYNFIYNALYNGVFFHYMEPPTILINIVNSTSFTRPTFGDTTYNIIYFRNSFKQTFIHEYVHYKQYLERIKKQKNYTSQPHRKKEYFNRPWEQQAWSIEYIDFLKNNLQLKKPGELLSQLRKMGLLHIEELNNLKRKNLPAWKKIMKQAIISVISNEKNMTDRFKWQKRELP